MIRNLSLGFFTAAFLLSYLSSCDRIKYPQGEALYQANCSTCHMPEGEGVARLYPALNSLKTAEVELDKIPCIIRHGQNKDDYSLEMAGVPSLTEIEINNITNYLLNDMNGMSIEYTIDRTKSNLAQCKEGS